MMYSLFIDIHTHNQSFDRPGIISVRNLSYLEVADIQPNLQLNNGYYSVGLHPWDSAAEGFNEDHLSEMVRLPEIIAIGECGLDRLRGADIKTQAHLFEQHVRIADQVEKPLIIHCVQAWQQIISIKKNSHSGVPWIIHGFRGKPELAAQLVDHGFYLSFGPGILQPVSSLKRTLRVIPDNRLFLETDASGLSIELIYEAAVKIKELSLSELQRVLIHNFNTVFKIHGTSPMAAKD
ncbi:MAG: TatD family hydrolase [Bacteroidales bacterium]